MNPCYDLERISFLNNARKLRIQIVCLTSGAIIVNPQNFSSCKKTAARVAILAPQLIVAWDKNVNDLSQDKFCKDTLCFFDCPRPLEKVPEAGFPRVNHADANLVLDWTWIYARQDHDIAKTESGRASVKVFCTLCYTVQRGEAVGGDFRDPGAGSCSPLML